MALRPDSNKPLAQRQAERESAEQEMLMREVDEAVRQDQAASFARRYGKIVAVLFVLGLAGFGGYIWWQDRHNAELETRSEDFIGALDELDAGNRQTADKELGALAEDGQPAVAAAAKMLQAGIKLEAGDPAAAAKLFDAVAEDGQVPDSMRDLARIRSVAATYDTLKPQQVIDRLKPLATPGNPWFGSAGELVAMAYLEQGKEDLAGPLFASIATDKDVPETLRSRTRQMAGILGYDAVEDVEATLNEIRTDGQAAAGPPAQ